MLSGANHYGYDLVALTFAGDTARELRVQSTLFPLHDRNPQTYVENIMYAKKADYRKATQSIWFDGATSSAVILPVVRRSVDARVELTQCLPEVGLARALDVFLGILGEANGRLTDPR